MAQKELITETGIPHWLQPPKHKNDTTPYYTEHTWETTLERLSGGETLASICRDQNMPEYGAYQRWIHKDPERKKRYREAQMLATEFHGDQMLDEMENQYDDNGMPKDINWQRERNNTRKFLMSCWNKERYSEKKDVANIEVNVGSLALDALRKRTVENVVENAVDGEIVG